MSRDSLLPVQVELVDEEVPDTSRPRGIGTLVNPFEDTSIDWGPPPVVDVQPLIEVRDRENDADLARTLIHEYPHALLHFDVDDDTERSKREVEAGAVAYVVGRYCGLDTGGPRSTSPPGSRTIRRSFATGSTESVGQQKNSSRASKSESSEGGALIAAPVWPSALERG